MVTHPRSSSPEVEHIQGISISYSIKSYQTPLFISARGLEGRAKYINPISFHKYQDTFDILLILKYRNSRTLCSVNK